MGQDTLTQTYVARKPVHVSDPALQLALDSRLSRPAAAAQGKGALTVSSLTLKRAAMAPPSRLQRDSSNLDSLLGEIDNGEKSNRGPTNFEGLGAMIGGGGGNVFASKRPRKELGKAKTFMDVASTKLKENSLPAADTSTKKVPGESREQLRGVMSQQQFSLPTPAQPAHQRPPPIPTALRPIEAQLPRSRRPHLDWSLKTQLRFTSDRPFRLAEEATVASTCCASASQPTNSEERYQRALQTFQHPAEQMEQGVLHALMKAKGGRALLAARRATWDAAFGSLFQQLRNGACDAFYLFSPQDTARCAFAVLFRAAGIGGCDAPHALISRSSSVLRALLREEAVEFSTPLAPEKAEVDAGTAAALADLEHSKAGKAARRDELAALDGQPGSLLTVVGETELHGLAEVLTNFQQRLFEETADVPLLLAPTLFPGACLKQLQPQVTLSSQAAQGGTSAARTPSGSSPQFKVKVEGLLPCWVTDRLVQVLAEAQEGKLVLACDTLPLSGNLNEHVPSPPPEEELCDEDLDDMDATQIITQAPPLLPWQARGFVSEEEAERWRTPVDGLTGRHAICSMDCRGGNFLARLAQRLAAPAGPRKSSLV